MYDPHLKWLLASSRGISKFLSWPLCIVPARHGWYLHFPGEVSPMGSRFPRQLHTRAHPSRRLLTLHLKTCSLFILFTSNLCTII